MLRSWIPGGQARYRKKTVLTLLAKRLSEFGPRFIARHDVVLGPGGCGVALLKSDHHRSSRHLDLAFAMDFQDPHAIIHDCVEAPGASDEDSWRNSIDLWASTTGVAVLEGLAGNGLYATHLDSRAPDGFAGWHTVHGGVMGWGTDDPNPLQDWLLANPVLPHIAPVVSGDLDRRQNNGIKIFFGGPVEDEIAEVRVNNRRHDAGSAVVAAMDWPRTRAYIRTFALLLHLQAD